MAKGIPVTHCRKCPYKDEINHWSSDGWDRMCDWVCTNFSGEPRKIQGGVEWHEESKIELPDWCPLPDIIEP